MELLLYTFSLCLYPFFGAFFMNDTLANTEKKTAYILTLPAVTLVFAIILFPIFANVWISFKEVKLNENF